MSNQKVRQRRLSPIEAAQRAAARLAKYWGHELGDWYRFLSADRADCTNCERGVIVQFQLGPNITIGGSAITQECPGKEE